MDRDIASSTSTLIACFLLFLCTFSSARSPFLNSISAKIGIDHINSFPVFEKNPDDANTILLPSEKAEPAKLIQLEPNSKTSEPRAETIESMEVPTATESSNPLPFTAFSFRPMDPRIPRRPSTSSFRPIHRCHHNHHYRPWNQHLPRRERKHGSDVILNNVKDKDFDPVVAGGGMRRDPARWMRFGHIEPMFSRERSMTLERRELLRKLYHRYHHHNHNQEPKIKDTGLVRRIRKFLNRI